MSYESPITVYQMQQEMVQCISEAQDEMVFVKIRQAVDVNKKELIKALQYDRNQYDKGYKDGLEDSVHVVQCKYCKYAREPQRNCREEACACEGVLVCENGADVVFEGEIGWKFVNGDFFCADGERKDGGQDATD